MDRSSVKVPGFKKKLNSKLLELDIKVSDLPGMMGGGSLSEQTIYSIIRRESTTVDTLSKISKALGVPVSYWAKDISVVNEPESAYGNMNIDVCREKLSAAYEKINYLNEVVKQCRETIDSKNKIIRMLELNQTAHR